jgi:uncharacterized protein YfdQ (DUF2303 family)
MSINSEALTLALSRRLAQADKRNQQATIIQNAARLLSGADAETKDSLMRVIAATPSERQIIISLTEKTLLAA